MYSAFATSRSLRWLPGREVGGPGAPEGLPDLKPQKLMWEFPKPILGFLYRGSEYFGSIFGAPELWKLPHTNLIKRPWFRIPMQ